MQFASAERCLVENLPLQISQKVPLLSEPQLTQIQWIVQICFLDQDFQEESISQSPITRVILNASEGPR